MTDLRKQVEGLVNKQRFEAFITIDLGDSGEWSAGDLQRTIQHELGDCTEVVVKPLAEPVEAGAGK